MFSNYVKTMNQGLIDTLSSDCLKRNDETAKFKVKYMEHQQASAWVDNLPGNPHLSLKPFLNLKTKIHHFPRLDLARMTKFIILKNFVPQIPYFY